MGQSKLKHTSLLFEELEPRLLFSADGAEAIAAEAVEQNVEEEPVIIVDLESLADEETISVEPTAGEESPQAADSAELEENTSDQEETDSPENTNPSEDTAIDGEIDQTGVEESAIVADNETEVTKEILPSELAESDSPTEIVFINDNVLEYELLISNIEKSNESDSTLEVVILDSSEDGFDQITNNLNKYYDLDAIHFITHGSDANIALGNDWLNNSNLNQNSDAIAGWGDALSESGDFLFYGCNIAADSAGQNLLENIAELTGADVTASDDKTGHEDFGADWVLEYQTGVVEESAVIGEAVPWKHTLAVVSNQAPWTNLATTTDRSTTISATYTVTAAPGSDRLLLATIVTRFGFDQTINVTSASFGGVQLHSIVSGSSDTTRNGVWMGYLLDSEILAGAQTLTVTFTSTVSDPTGTKLLAATYVDVDQTTPINDSSANNTDVDAPISFGSQIDYVAGGEVVYVASFGGNSNTNTTEPAGYSKIYTNEWSGLLMTTIGHKDDTTTAGNSPASTAVDFEGTDANHSIAVVALNPVGFNNAPSLSISGTGTTTAGALYTLNLTSTEPGITSWTIDWGDGTTETIAGSPSSVTHVYNTTGFTYNILASASDGSSTFFESELLVPSYTTNDGLVRYEPISGDFLQQFATGDGLTDPYEVIVGPDGNTYVTGNGSNNVLRYDPSGNFIDEFVIANSGGLDEPIGLAFGPDSNLYVGSFNTNSVLRYDGTTGAFIDSFASGGGLSNPMSVAFGADGNLYVAGFSSNNVVRYDGTTGAFIDVFTSGGGLTTPEDMAFGPDGNLYITSPTSNEVLRYNGTTGNFIDVFTSGGSLNGATGLAFSPDGYLYVSSYYGDNVQRFDATTGVYVDDFFAGGTGGLDGPTYLDFVPGHQVTVTSAATNNAPIFIDGSVGNWSFDEGSGDSIAESVIGISTGTLGSTAGADANDPTWTTGKFGQALRFDGVDDYVEIADAPELDISGPEFSASLWIKPESGPNTEDMLFMKGDREGNVNYYLSWKDSGKMTWAFKDSATFDYIDMDVTLPTVGEWNHVVIVFNRPTVSLYINGTEYTYDNIATGGSMDRDLTANDEALWIGAGRSGGSLVGVDQYSGPFHGSIDELALFGRALTDAEVEAIRTSTPPVVTASSFSIDENSANNTVVGTVVANDKDIGDTLSYAITAGNTGGAFSIDANGQIKVASSAALDFETNPVFNLTIEATDDGIPSLSDTVTVTIALNDLNDAPSVTTTGLDLDYTEGDGAVIVDSGISITDPDSATITGATIQIATGYVSGEDILAFSTLGPISGTWDTPPGTLTLSGSDTVANYQAALQTITYQNSSSTPDTTTRTITFAVSDGIDVSETSSRDVTISSVNNTPVLSWSGGTTLSYSENDAATVLNHILLIGDTDDTHIESTTVQISGNYQIGEDILGFTNTASISGSWDNGSGTLTLTGSDTKINYQNAIRSITYLNTSDSPNTSNRSLSYTVSDGDDLSNTVNSNITITPVNDAPVLSGSGLYLTTITEDTITNDGDLVSAIIASAGGDPITDVDAGSVEGMAIFSLSNSNGIWEYDTGSGWTPVGSVSVNSSLLLRDTDSLRFVPSADWNGTELFTFAAWDQTSGTAGTKVDTSTYGDTTAFSAGTAIPSITVDGVNDAPTIAVTNSTPTFTENGSPVSLFSGTNVDPIETSDLIDTLQLTVDSLADGSDEILVVDGQSIELTHLNNETTATNSYDVDVNVSGSTATVVITKTGGFSAIAADTLINGLAYNNASENPQGAVRSVNLISIKDDGGTAGGGVDTTGIGISSLVTISAVNDAPSVTTTGTQLAYVEGDGETIIDPDLTLSDIDNVNLTSASVRILAGFSSAEDTLNFTDQLGITGSYDGVTGILSLSGSASTTDYQTVLRTVTYSNSSEMPSTTNRVINFQVSDGAASAGSTRTITVDSINDDPTNEGSLPTDLVFIEDTQSKLDLSAINLSDVDAGSGDLTLTITSDNGHLQTMGWPGLTLGGSQTVLTLTGNLTDLNDFLNDVNSIDYEHATPNTSGDNVDLITVEINDNGNTGSGGGGTITLGTVNIDITPVNDSPTIATNTGATFDEGSTDNIITVAMLNEGDSDDSGSEVTYTLDADPVNGRLFLSGAQLAAGATFTQNDINSGNVTYDHNGTETASDSFDFTITDGGEDGATSVSGTFNLTINSINDAPVLAAIGDQSVDELATLAFTATATDSDLPADTLTFSLDATSIAAGMTITAGGDFSWTPAEGQGGSAPSVTITVTDSGTGNMVDSETFTITVGGVNTAPVLDAIGNQTVDELATLVFTATATDSDLPADTLTFSLDAASIAAGMTITAGGDFSWAPAEGLGGSTPSVTITVTDNGTGNLIDSETFTITVNDINVAPVLASIGNQTVDELATLNFTATATDSDLPADTLTFSLDAASIAAGMTITADGDFSWTPAEGQGGSASSVTITVTDSGTGNLVDSETFTITVNDTNVAPVLASIGNQTVNELATLNFTATATDSDLPADTLTFSLDAASIAAGMTITADGDFSWTPAEGQGGSAPSVTITVTDNGTGNLVDSETFTITVNDINFAPVLAAIGNQTVDELATLAFTATATDSDLPADTLTFSLDAASIAAGMTITAGGDFSWTPAEGQGGSAPSVTITVTDNGTGNLIDSETFTITVNDINVAPVLGTIGNQTVDELATLAFTAIATDSDLPADTLTFSLDAASIAAGMTITAGGDFSWTPAEGQGGSAPSVTITVTDSGTGNLIDSETFTITVNDINVAPVLAAIGDQTVDELATLSFTATATDSDLPADTLTFSLDAASIAAGMTITAGGDFSWTPTEGLGGSTPSVIITVTDSGTGNLVDSETFTITVTDINIAPVLDSIGNQTVDELATLNFTATATDSDLPADTLTFSLDAASISAGMTITAGGDFSWTPAEGQGGSAPSVTITVTDSGTGNLVDSETFTITVNDINVAPVLAAIGNQTVDELATLAFTATAIDSDLPADTLTFSLDAASIAAGMTITAGGDFSWTPAEGLGGSTPSVTITVTDSGTGNLVDSETFTITVNDINSAPILAAIGNQTVDELSTLAFTATATDSDLPADTLSFSLDAASIAAGMTITAGGDFSWTPAEGLGGSTPSVTITVTDNGTGNLVDSETFTITVNDVNSAPVLAAIGNQTVDELATLAFTATATDSDLPADTLTFSLDATSITAGMTITAGGDFSWTPTEGQGGSAPSVTITVTDSGTGNLIDSETFTITVNDINVAPVLAAIGNQTVDELSTLAFTATATDSDLPADTLTFSLDAASIAAGMNITAGGDFSWTPAEGQGGSAPSVTITVTDNGTGNLIDSETFTITVGGVNTAPVLDPIGDQSVDELATLAFTATATDSDLPADTLTFSLDAASIAAGMTITAGGDFSWTPAEGLGGSAPSVTITVTDNGTGNLIDSETFIITVNDINVTPVLDAIGNQTVDELVTLSFTATATDSDLPADTLTFSLDAASITAGMTITAGGDFSWTPAEGFGGSAPSVTVTVTDSGTGNLVDSETFTITVNDINVAPVLAAIGNQTVDELSTLAFTATATDSDLPADTLTFSLDAASIAAGMNITAGGDFSWTPAEGQGGSAPSVTITVTDNGTGNLIDSETFTITVGGVNTAPVLDPIGDQSVDELATLAFTATATDSDLPADTLTFSLDAASIAAGMTITAGGDFSWTPAEGQGGSAPSVTITVTDSGTGNLVDSETFTITVNDVNSAPVLAAIGNQTVDELATLTFTATATDSDLPADTLTFSLDAASIAAGMTITAGGDFSWTPAEGQDGPHSVTVTVTDDGTGTLTDFETFTITVNDINSAPVLAAIGNQTVDELATLTFTATATDSDLPADTLTFSLDATSITAGMTITAGGDFSWTPTEGQGGSAPSVTITVTDSGTGNLIDSETFTITVNDINVAPVLAAIGNQTVDELANLTFTATATDSDLPADTLTFSLDAASIAAGMTITAGGDFSWTPAEGLGGSTPSVTITVTDNGTGNLIDSETFTITVGGVNTAPVLDPIGDQSVDELATLAFTATATDSDLPADTLTFSLDAASLAVGMSITAGGDFSWTPAEGQGGSAPYVTITVTDSGTGNLVDSETFTITVNDLNSAPVLAAIGNQTVDELATLAFTATATDSDLPADTLTFSLDAASITAGMTITAGGDFSWTPAEGLGGSTPSVTITVTDSGTGNLIDSETFTITVTDINVAPVLAAIGNQTVDELATLTFAAIATDSDLPADTLTFSLDAASIAAGMTITAGGDFSWTPTEAQGGSAPSVTITVTDSGTGNLIDSETFTITVNDINVAPVLDAIGDQSVDELATLALTATATDSDLPADTLAFSLDAASIAAGMTITAGGDFSWTPSETQGGSTPSVTITVTDSGTGNLVDSETFIITVNDINVAPVLGAIGNQTVDELATLSFTATATDSDLPADTLTFSLDAASLAAGMSITSGGDFSWTPAEGQGGSAPSVTITVTDNGTGNLIDSETFTITVNDINTAPVLAAIGDQTVDELATLAFTATATDSDLPADTLTCSLDATSIAAGMTITAGGDFSWTPAEGQGGSAASVTITVTDSGTGNLIDSETFTITVNDINTAPVLAAIGNQTVDELATLAFTATATDSDLPADTLTFSLDATSIAAGMTITAGGDFSWTPAEGQGGSAASVTITVTDSGTGNLIDSETFTITVVDINTAPVLAAIGNQTVDELANLTFTATATDSDLPADTLTFSLDAASIAAGMTITAGGDFSWTPTENQDGAHTVTVTVTDDGTGLLTDSETFTITVNDINSAPVLTAIGDQTVDELATLNFTATATDSDIPADTLTFSLDATSFAAGMNIDAVTGDFSWTPTEGQDGPHSVTVTVTDDGSGTLSDSETFTIAVNEINNNDPIATDDSITVDEGATITTLDGGATSVLTNDTDADLPSDSLTVTLGIGPGHGSLILNVDGTFSYTHDGSENFSDSFTYIVSDADGGITDTGIVSITINPVNDNAPAAVDDSASGDEDTVISGTVLVNDSDVDGDPLTASLVTGPANGSLAFNSDGSFSYIPNPNWNGTDSFTYTANDGTQNSNVATATITVNGVNDAPSIGGVDTGSVTEDIDPDLDTLIEAFGALTIIDPDVGESNFQAATVTGTYGDLTIDASGNWSYNANNTQAPIQQLDAGQTLTDTLSVATADGTTQVITVTINGAEDASVIGGTATGSVVEDGTLSVTNTLTITDVDTSDNPINFIDEAVIAGDNGYGSFVMTSNSWSYTLDNSNGAVQALDNGDSLSDSHTFTASDGSTQVVTVTINGSSDAVVTDPGPEPDPDPLPDPDPDPLPDPDSDPLPDPEPDPDPVDDPPPDEELITDSDDTEDPDDTYIPPTPEIDTTPVEDEIPVDENPAENVAVRILNSPDADPIAENANASETSVESEEQYLGYIGADSGQIIPQIQESGELRKQVIKHNYTSVLLNSFRAALHEATDFIISPVSAAPIFMDMVDMSSIMENPTMRGQLEIMHQEMDESFEKSASEQKTVVYAVSGVSATFAAGVVSYLLRAGSLMTSFLATMPIWKGFDPVSILVTPQEKSKKEKKTEAIDSAGKTSEENAETMFHED